MHRRVDGATDRDQDVAGDLQLARGTQTAAVERHRRVADAERACDIRFSISDDEGGAAIELGKALVGVCAAQDDVSSARFDQIAARRAADDAAERMRADVDVEGARGSGPDDLAHGDRAAQDEIAARDGIVVALEDDLIVDAHDAAGEVVDAEVTADVAAVQDEASIAEGEAVADRDGGVRIDAHIAREAHVACGQHDEAAVAIHKGGRVPGEVTGLRADFDFHLTSSAAAEEVFKDRGAATADEDGAKGDAAVAAAAAEEVLAAGSRAERGIEIEGLRLLRIAEPPVTAGHAGHVQRLGVVAVVEAEHAGERPAALHFDLSGSWHAAGDDAGQCAVVGQRDAAQREIIRLQRDGVAGDVHVVREAQVAAGIDGDRAGAEGRARAAHRGGDGADGGGPGRAVNDGAAIVAVRAVEHREAAVAEFFQRTARADDLARERGLVKGVLGGVDARLRCERGRSLDPDAALQRQGDHAVAIHRRCSGIIGDREVPDTRVLHVAVASDGGVTADENVPAERAGDGDVAGDFRRGSSRIGQNGRDDERASVQDDVLVVEDLADRAACARNGHAGEQSALIDDHGGSDARIDAVDVQLVRTHFRESTCGVDLRLDRRCGDSDVDQRLASACGTEVQRHRRNHPRRESAGGIDRAAGEDETTAADRHRVVHRSGVDVLIAAQRVKRRIVRQRLRTRRNVRDVARD